MDKFLVCSAFVAATCVAAATDVSGDIKLANGRAAGHAVVYFTGHGHGTPLKRAVVDQRNMAFIPHISVVTVGTTIQFPNNDTVFHNVYADFDAKKFDLGYYPRGETKRQTFSKPGLVALSCSIHSQMSAYVMVVDTNYYAVADANGHYRVNDLPPGEYFMNVWFESGQHDSRQVNITGSEAVSNSTTHR